MTETEQSGAPGIKPLDVLKSVWGIGRVVLIVYMFLIGVSLIEGSFRLIGGGVIDQVFTWATSPLNGLFIGILATSLIQSSSATTSMVVGFVSAGFFPLRIAVPIIMGANIGTSVTATIVSLVHMTRRTEFKRALSAATVHDFFNILVTLILFPLEMSTHFLERSAVYITNIIGHISGVEFQGPLKVMVKPVANTIIAGIDTILPLPNLVVGIIILILALGTIAGALIMLVRNMKAIMMSRIENVFDRVLFKNPVICMAVGTAVTVSVQSSSVTTSLMVPIMGAGLLSLEQVFPFVLGANVGTTVTALLAAMAGSSDGLAIAIVHLLFNFAGILIIYPLRPIRAIPLAMARYVASACAHSAPKAIGFIVFIYFLIPTAGILIGQRLLNQLP